MENRRTIPAGRGLVSEFPGPQHSPGLMLWRTSQAWQAAHRTALKPFGLTNVQFVLLASLVWLREEEPVTQRMLADYARTDIMMTSQVLRTLEQKGLIERDPHPTDARARSLVPTLRGVRLANEAVRVVEEADRAFFRPLADDRRELLGLLRALVP